MKKNFDVVVCGHLCLDLLPQMDRVPLQALASPGKLFEIGSLQFATGGVVSNTGQALRRLGVDVRLMAKVGADLIGQATLDLLRSQNPTLAQAIKVDAAQPGAYSIVLAPEHADRIFLHCTGPNQTFSAADVDLDLVAQARLFHFGYPTLLPHFLKDDGRELGALFQSIQQRDVITSMDLSLPDPAGVAGHLDWRRWFENTLPYLDVFVPSLNEAQFMLRRADYDRWGGDFEASGSWDYVRDFASELLEIGSCALVGFKLGKAGIYLRANDRERLLQLPGSTIDAATWANQEVMQPAFAVTVAGTTGAGDAAYAGLIAALLRSYSIKDCAGWAAAVGASCVEAVSATDGILTWAETQQRLDTDWSTPSG